MWAEDLVARVFVNAEKVEQVAAALADAGVQFKDQWTPSTWDFDIGGVQFELRRSDEKWPHLPDAPVADFNRFQVTVDAFRFARDDQAEARALRWLAMALRGRFTYAVAGDHEDALGDLAAST